VSISALGYYPNPLAPDPAERTVYHTHLRAVIDAARLLGLSTVNTFLGRDPARSIDDNWPLFREVWPPLVRYAAERGINIGIENCPMLFTEDEWPGGTNLAISPAIWRRMFEEIPDANFGLNYDPSHMIWQQMDEVRPIEEFAPRLFHVHAKDVRLDRRRLDEAGVLAVPLAYHTPKLPGLGDVRWGAFFAALTDVGYRGVGNVEVRDIAEPSTPPGHVKIAVQVAGICGTDLHIYYDEYRSWPPVVLGHEVAGCVAEVGSGVERVRPGDRVTTETYFYTCGACHFCRAGRINLCPERRSIGSAVHGGFTSHLVVPERNVHVLPEGIGYLAGALTEPLAC